jgi:hypothetical protein
MLEQLIYLRECEKLLYSIECKEREMMLQAYVAVEQRLEQEHKDVPVIKQDDITNLVIDLNTIDDYTFAIIMPGCNQPKS